MESIKSGLKKKIFLAPKIVSIGILLFFAMLSCSKGPESSKQSSTSGAVSKPEELRRKIESTNQGPQNQVDSGRKQNLVIDRQSEARKIVKNGEISFETSDPNNTRNFIERTVKETQGYISGEEQSKTDKNIWTRIIVRVPVENFDKLVGLIVGGLPHIEKKIITANDVTEDYIDIEARIKTQKELEIRYIELLRQARKIEDIIEINQELANVRENIESAEGKLKHLANSVAYSVLVIEYYQRSTSVNHFLGKIWQGMKSGSKYFALFIIGLAHIWPFLVLAGVIIAVIIIMKKRRCRKIT